MQSSIEVWAAPDRSRRHMARPGRRVSVGKKRGLRGQAWPRCRGPSEDSSQDLATAAGGARRQRGASRRAGLETSLSPGQGGCRKVLQAPSWPGRCARGCHACRSASRVRFQGVFAAHSTSASWPSEAAALVGNLTRIVSVSQWIRRGHRESQCDFARGMPSCTGDG